MASITVDPVPPPDRLTLESIPTIDLRLLSQSELTALSLCSSRAFDLRRCDDVVIPKIDRSVFNESAGSRKQTYSRLRLAPRKPDVPSSGLTPKPRTLTLTPTLTSLDSERLENSRIIALFKHLFNSSPSQTSDELVPVNVEFSDVTPSIVAVPVSVVVGGSERKRGRKPRLALDVVGDNVDGEREGGEEGTRLEEREKEVMTKNGVAVDLAELAKAEDPFGQEIRRRTQGMEKPEELLGFLGNLEGQWGSRRKKRKIIDANEFGDALPNGWKVLMGMKKKQGQAWLFCRRYISPNGRYFVSCKEVSSYLLSLTSPHDSKQQSTVQCTEDSVDDNKLASGNAVDNGVKIEDQSLDVTSQSAGYEIQQMQLCTSETIDHEKQLTFTKSVEPGEFQAACILKCHKCSSPFIKKDELLNHLLSCHKRKRRKSGEPIEDDVTMKDGKYECQFCNKIFHERNSYFGHVGMHVKNYAKSIGGSPSVTPKQKASGCVSIDGVPVAVSETLELMELNADSVAGTSNILASSDLNVGYVDSKLRAVSAAETHTENSNNEQNLSLHVELNLEAAQNDKVSVDIPSEKQDEIVETTDNKVREVDEAATIDAVKPDFHSGPGTLLSNNENNDLCENSGKINATEYTGSKISKPSYVMVGNAENCSLPDQQQVDLGNDGNSVAVHVMESEGVASVKGLPADDEEMSASDQKSEDTSSGNESLDHRCSDGVKVGEHNELMLGSGSGNLDLDMDAAGDVQHTGSLEERSVVPHEEEETCGITDEHTGFMGSEIADGSELESGYDNSSCTPSGNQQIIGMQSHQVILFSRMVNDTEVELCGLEKAEMTVDAEQRVAQGRHSGSSVLVSEDNGHSITSDAEKVSVDIMTEPRGTGDFHAEPTCSLENSTRLVLNRVGEEPKSDQVVNSSDLILTSRSSDTHLDANVMNNNQQDNVSAAFSHLSSGSGRAHNVSNVLGAYNNFVEDKQKQVPKHVLSGLSINDHMHGVAINNVNNASTATTTAQLPDLDKMDGSSTNKLILDFGSMGGINARFLNSVQHETIPEGSSPFSLWGEQTCGVQDNQNRVYGGSRGLSEPERASGNNPFNLVGLQQPCDAGYNLNKVSVNKRSYSAQRNDSAVYSRSTQARTEGMSHGNTLNLAGFHQQCDTGYNLNQPCINQQTYGVQHKETGAYGTSNETRQERVAYGNSLSLASVQQTRETGYSLNKVCVPQTCDTEYSLNKEYLGSIQGFSKFGELDQSQNRDLIGFGNNGARPNQGVTTEFMWRAAEGNILPGGLVDSSSSQGQSSGSFQAFDFLSDKGGSDLYSGNEKFDNMSSFEGLRSTSVEPMEFSFLTTQDSNTQLEDPKVLSYNTEMDQGFGSSSAWHQKGTSLPNMMGGQVVSTMCVWCGNEFHQDSLGCEMQAGSIGYLCPACKARMSVQFL